jgi:SAM-dependent methyltransferase
VVQTINNLRTSSTSFVAKKEKWSVSIALSFRKKRFAFVKALLVDLPKPLHILDVGGTQGYWEHMGFTGDDLQLTLLNTEPIEVTLPNVTSVIGDARDMCEFKDKEFEVVFSNAVIEHVGNFDQQRRMAEEVQRVGKRYILHTPNRYFPIEPHVLIPFFQFLPLSLKVFIAIHSPNWGWKSSHLGELSTIRLMSERELRSIFPGARVYKERFWGLTKSFILYKGW